MQLFISFDIFSYGIIISIYSNQCEAYNFILYISLQYHGGTNFGHTSGGPFIATSYDYDAPLDEYGKFELYEIRIPQCSQWLLACNIGSLATSCCMHDIG